MADSTPILAPLPRPECAGRGCRWCAHSGRWPDPTVGAVRRSAASAERASNVGDFPGR